MSKINSINNKSAELTVDSSAGDSYTQYDINTAHKFIMGADATDDSFRISQGNALGTNDTFKMTSAGERTLPLNPCFLVFKNNDSLNVTGDGTVWTVVWDTEIYDQGNDFASNTFTAPVTGMYFFSVSVDPTGLSSDNTSWYVQLVTTGATYRGYLRNPWAYKYVNTTLCKLDVIAPMTATDTAYVQLMIGGSAKDADIQGNAGTGGPMVNYFSGSLIC